MLELLTDAQRLTGGEDIMRRTLSLVLLTASIAALGTLSPSAGVARQRHPPAAGHAVPRPPVRPGAVVFIGGYYYDPFFGPYPWWPRAAYPYLYYPVYDDRAVLRVLVKPDNAGVYVDGFYAGIVDDFNGFFQGLPLPPGGHEVVLYLEEYGTVHRRIYLAPGSTFKLEETMERLPAGVASEPPTLAPPPPPPPEGSYMPPHTAPRTPAPPPRTAEARPGIAVGTLTLRVQPASAEVWIDGERWASSDGGRFAIQLPAGPHHLEVVRTGYRQYSSEIEIRDGEMLPLNVSLMPERFGSAFVAVPIAAPAFAQTTPFATASCDRETATFIDIRLPEAVLADGKPLAAGTYQVRITTERPTPAVGQSASAECWVEFLANGGAVAGREMASVVSTGDIGTVAKGPAPTPSTARVDLLKEGDYVRVWMNSGGTHYLVNMAVAR